ncbi:CAP domain-containing protein [bacterium]|nr:CAP domain-containing protein [bacterium]
MLRRLIPALTALCVVFASACGGGGSATTPWPNYPGEEIKVNMSAANAAIERLNIYRAQAGVPPVTLDLDLSYGAQAHANYLDYNGISLSVVGLSAHEESPSLPGYTTEGKTAARNSVIYQGVAPVEAIDNWTRTFYHRIGMFDPNLLRVGFGSSGGYQVMDINRGRMKGFGAEAAVVAYPGPGMSNVPSSFKEEIPMPVSDTKMGIPITVEFFGGLGQEISEVTATITDTRNGNTIPYYMQLPYRPLLPDWRYEGLVALIPKDPLPGNTVIEVAMNGMVDGDAYSVTWQFATR